MLLKSGENSAKEREVCAYRDQCYVAVCAEYSQPLFHIIGQTYQSVLQL